MASSWQRTGRCRLVATSNAAGQVPKKLRPMLEPLKKMVSRPSRKDARAFQSGRRESYGQLPGAGYLLLAAHLSGPPSVTSQAPGLSVLWNENLSGVKTVWLGPPAVPSLGEGSPTKIDRKKGYPCSNSTGPRLLLLTSLDPNWPF